MLKLYRCSYCGATQTAWIDKTRSYRVVCNVCGRYMDGPLICNTFTINKKEDPKMGYEVYKKEVEFSNVGLHADICRELNELYKRKNHDYGDSFHQTYLEEGMAMARIRLADKFSRFKSLTRGEKQSVTDESIRDTLIDLANYAIMTVMEMDREKEET